MTAAGSRLLAQRLSSPLTDPAAIAVRLDAVDVFAADPDLRRDVRQRLARTPDLERALTRLTVGRGGPREAPGGEGQREQEGGARGERSERDHAIVGVILSG